MSTYRDSFEKCPRCQIELVDARSARGCSACGGLWVQEEILAEMIMEMLPPGPLGRLQLAVLERDEPSLPCPSCGEKMTQTTLRHVPIERCAKLHGVWFDKDELGTALVRCGNHGAHGAALPEMQAAEAETPVGLPRTWQSPPPLPPLPSEPERSAYEAPARMSSGPHIRFEIAEPGQTPRTVGIAQSIIKIGKLASAHVSLADESVSRMHAVIEWTAESVELIDLGTKGTFINGEKVNKRALHSGDQIRMGNTTLTVTFVA